MKMTSPVFSTAGQTQSSTTDQAARTARMQFPMESKYRSLESLPLPQDARYVCLLPIHRDGSASLRVYMWPMLMAFRRHVRVERRQEEGRTVAVLSFSGIPLDWEVLAAERKLRGLLLVDRLRADDTYMVARYNEPFVPPPFKRNEILITLKELEADEAV